MVQEETEVTVAAVARWVLLALARSRVLPEMVAQAERAAVVPADLNSSLAVAVEERVARAV